MPPLSRDLIGMADYGERVVDHIKNGLSPAAIATELSNDAVFMDKIGRFGHAKVFPTDIHRFMAKEIQHASALLGDGLGKSDSATLTIKAVQERILSVSAMSDDFESLARRCINILERDLDKYETEREAAEQYNSTQPDEKSKRLLPVFPFDLVTTARKNLIATVNILQALRGDHQLQALVRAQTINVKNGISQEELHEALFDTGAELGLTRSQILEAYTKALIKRKNRAKGAIDVEAKPAEEGKWQGRLPFASALEQSSGLFPAGSPAKAPSS